MEPIHIGCFRRTLEFANRFWKKLVEAVKDVFEPETEIEDLETGNNETVTVELDENLRISFIDGENIEYALKPWHIHEILDVWFYNDNGFVPNKEMYLALSNYYKLEKNEEIEFSYLIENADTIKFKKVGENMIPYDFE